jgi:hypothetical protein
MLVFFFPVVIDGSANHFLLQAAETSSGDVEEIPMPSATMDLATSAIASAQVADPSQSTEKPIVTASAVPPSLGEVCPSSLAPSIPPLPAKLTLFALSGL